ncbi:MAG: type II CAAX endopeptidase family protein [Planctomycetota bacterium]
MFLAQQQPDGELITASQAGFLAFTIILAIFAAALVWKLGWSKIGVGWKDQPGEGGALLIGSALAWFATVLGGIGGLAMTGWESGAEMGLGENAAASIVGTIAVAITCTLAAMFWNLGGMFRSEWKTDTLAGLITFFVTFPLLLALSQLVALLDLILTGDTETVGHETLALLRESDRGIEWWALVIAVSVFVPIAEEVTYRGFLQGGLRKVTRSPWIAIFATTIIFTLMHGGIASPHTLPVIATLSIALGVVMEKTKSIWPCALAHGIFNATNVGMAMMVE